MKKLSFILVCLLSVFQVRAAGGDARNHTAYISAGLEMMKYTFDKSFVSPDYYTAGMGFALGYRWESLAAEFKYASHSGEQSSDSIGGTGPSLSVKSSMEDTIYGIGLHWNFLYFLHLRAGYNFYEVTGKGSAVLTSNGVASTSASDAKTEKSSGVFYGGGLNIPIFSGSDLYADYIQYVAKDGKANSYEFGYRFYF